MVAGLRPDRFEVPYQPYLGDDGPLRWAAAPILNQVADELEGTGVGLLLTDARGQVIDWRAAGTGILARLDRIRLGPGFLSSEDLIGTNAIGSAITQEGPSVMTGAEHFADALTPMACAATPVTDGAGQIIGVIDLTRAAKDFSPRLAELDCFPNGQWLTTPPSYIPALTRPGHRPSSSGQAVRISLPRCGGCAGTGRARRRGSPGRAARSPRPAAGSPQA